LLVASRTHILFKRIEIVQQLVSYIDAGSSSRSQTSTKFLDPELRCLFPTFENKDEFVVNVPARTQLVLAFDDDDYIFPPRNVDNFKYYVGIRIYTWILLNIFFVPHRFTTY
jgi:hypothetical protein